MRSGVMIATNVELIWITQHYNKNTIYYILKGGLGHLFLCSIVNLYTHIINPPYSFEYK